MTRWFGMALMGLGLAVGAVGGTQLGDGHRAVRQAHFDEAEVPVVVPVQRVTDWWARGGPAWLVGCGLVLAGALIARRGGPGPVSLGDEGGRPQRVAEALDQIKAEVLDLQRRAEGIEGDAPELRDAIDRLRAARIDPLIAARDAYAREHGLAIYANTYGAIAAVERNLARTWSALTDAHAPTAQDALCRALDAVDQAVAADAVAARARADAEGAASR